jgi:hypothetical protein
MWNTQLANFSLVQSMLTDDHAAAKAALAAGASALLTFPRRATSLLDYAIRLQSLAFVDLLMSHGAKAGDAEMAALVEQVQHATDPSAVSTRRVRALAALMHLHGANFDAHIETLTSAQPDWFKGIHAHHQSQVAKPFSDHPVARVRRRLHP